MAEVCLCSAVQCEDSLAGIAGASPQRGRQGEAAGGSGLAEALQQSSLLQGLSGCTAKGSRRFCPAAGPCPVLPPRGVSLAGEMDGQGSFQGSSPRSCVM